MINNFCYANSQFGMVGPTTILLFIASFSCLNFKNIWPCQLESGKVLETVSYMSWNSNNNSHILYFGKVEMP